MEGNGPSKEEAEACQVMEEELTAVAAARCRAILATVETAVEEAGTEEDSGSPSKQKGWMEGKQLACDCCSTRGFKCQVSQKKKSFLSFY